MVCALADERSGQWRIGGLDTGAIADAIDGHLDEAQRSLAVAEPMAAEGPARANTVLLPSTMVGREIAVPPDPAVVRGHHRQLIDAARLHEPIAFAMQDEGQEPGSTAV